MTILPAKRFTPSPFTSQLKSRVLPSRIQAASAKYWVPVVTVLLSLLNTSFLFRVKLTVALTILAVTFENGTLAAPSPAVVDVLNFCGLADDFGLAVAITVGEPS